ncbi:type I-E CRISPR-associated protein Cas6/Cse3/CasE [Streptomyces sp. CC210A]|uniref:type I-E CRISPR-associated protein Cas6/Cse3/CasE n=1 Tax=Streptomyces sp. CC210A TaxID=2898184 RepID=UPI001F32E406|nr:type I-E CRISPR-associated protein Cas6/Cse3/CasE [Streptomyces sp. CC210A]
MYLTRFRVNTARPGSRRLLSSPQAMHAAVMSSFPHLLPTGQNTPRILWRIDHNARAEVVLYILSPDQPDLTHLVEQAGWPAAAANATADTRLSGWQSYPYTPFLDHITTGSTWGFRLTANPVHHIRRKDGEPTKRTAHITPRHQMQWLLERQERSGFRILTKPAHQRLTQHGTDHDLVVHNRRDLRFAKPADTTKRTVSVLAVTFDGRLEVTDPAALRHTLTAGLGKAKAYGCGLMTLAPIG